jgi:CubicO group peptidase (beta-lactamase class C family)
MKKPIFISLAIMTPLLLLLGLLYTWKWASIAAAYKAKTLCSGVFVSKRAPEAVLESDLEAGLPGILRYIDAEIDLPARRATSNLFGLMEQTAVYRPGLGCTLQVADYENVRPVYPARDNPHSSPNRSVREKKALQSDSAGNADYAPLQGVLHWAFSEPDGEHPRRTRAVVILHHGKIVAEQYAPGFGSDTPLPGWSMTKSVMNALAGILIQEGRLSLADRVVAPEWKNPDDKRGRITLEHLLHMTSGLAFDDSYANPFSDVIRMLFLEPDTAAYAADKPLPFKPGTRWHYSSGTANILSRVVREAVGERDYPSFPRRALFEPLGMRSAVIEPDASGTFVGSSYMYASARDWAKFGQLYLQNGIHQGKRILPDGWTDYTATPAPRAPKQKYGALFWLRIPKKYRSRSNARPLPEDAFHAVGHEGQFITVIPSRDLVIVRLGLTRSRFAWQQDLFVAKVLEVLGYSHSREPE